MAKTTRFLVDTTILVAHIRQQKAPTLFDRARKAYGEPIASDATVFELEIGARRAGRQLEFQTTFADLKTYPLSQSVLIKAAALQADLLRKNQAIGLLDTFIAATALYHSLPLFSLNIKHFERIPDLQLLLEPPEPDE